MIERDVDVVFANQSELAILFGTDDYNTSSDTLGGLVDIAGIKLGKNGSLVLYNGKKTLLPPRPIQARDSTGAGDMYAAGFLACLSKNLGVMRAGEIGGYLAEEIIQSPGAQFELNQIQQLKTSLF